MKFFQKYWFLFLWAANIILAIIFGNQENYIVLATASFGFSVAVAAIIVGIPKFIKHLKSL